MDYAMISNNMRTLLQNLIFSYDEKKFVNKKFREFRDQFNQEFHQDEHNEMKPNYGQLILPGRVS